MLPLLAMGNKMPFEECAVELHKINHVGHVFLLNLSLLIFVLCHIIIVVFQTSVCLGITSDVGFLVHLPYGLIFLPVPARTSSKELAEVQE